MALGALTLGALAASIVPLGVKLLIGLGFGFVTYSGVEFAITEAETWLATQYAGMAANTLAMAKIAGFTTGFSMVLSAYTAYIGIKLATGAFTRFKVTPTG